jgi:uncharacterized protein YdhG (YjbR/CyaY superfamily)
VSRALTMNNKPTSINDYLSGLSRDNRRALQSIRKAIKAAAPRAEECISYQLPAFRLDGRMLVWFGAASRHCSFYPGAEPIRVLQRDLEGYDTSKGTVRFPADRPLSAALVRKLVRARIAERADTKRKSALDNRARPKKK